MSDHPTFIFAIFLVGACMAVFVAIAYAFKVPLYEKKVLVPENEINLTHRIHVADDLFSAVFFPFMAYLAISGTIEYFHEESIEARWMQTTSKSYWFILLYVSRMILHLPVQTLLLWDDSKGLLGQMTAHHIFSALCFGAGLLTKHMHFWGLFAGCCEFTTGCLAILCISMNCFPPDHRVAGIVTAVMGSILWLGFLVFRIILFPVWLYIYFSDIAKAPEETWDIMSPIERISYPAVVLMIFVLSLMWMWPITRGLLKVLGLTSEASSGSEEEREKLVPVEDQIKRKNSYASPLVKSSYKDLPVVRGKQKQRARTNSDSHAMGKPESCGPNYDYYDNNI